MRANSIIIRTIAAWILFSPSAVALTTPGRTTATKLSSLAKAPAELLRWMPPLRQSKLDMSTTEEEEPSKFPVTRFSKKVNTFLAILDSTVLQRVLRIVNHAPALASLSYFGLISMASMMGMGPLSSATANVATKATLSSVLTQTVGTTTNSQFAALFPTNITPAASVFLVWPIIAVLQLITVVTSALFPTNEEFLSQSDLGALTLANLCSAAWLVASSKATAGSLPIGSFLILPLVPFFSGYPLRNKPTNYLPAYQLYSSFTTLASFLAFAVELQYGGRIPFFGSFSGEVASSIFLLLYSTATLAVPEKSLVKRFVNFGALSGILYKRVLGAMAIGAGGFWGVVGSLVMSFSFYGTVGCWCWSLKEFVGSAFSSKKKS